MHIHIHIYHTYTYTHTYIYISIRNRNCDAFCNSTSTLHSPPFSRLLTSCGATAAKCRCISCCANTACTHTYTHTTVWLSACLRGKCDLCRCLFWYSVAESYKLTDSKGKSALASVIGNSGLKSIFFQFLHFICMMTYFSAFFYVTANQPSRSICVRTYICFYMRVRGSEH